MVRQKSEGPGEPKLLRGGGAAYELRLHPFTVRGSIQLGKIQAVRIGLEARIPRSKIERLTGSTDERLLVLYGRVSGHGGALAPANSSHTGCSGASPSSQRFPDGFWRGWVFVCGHLLWCVTRCLQALFEEDFGGCQVAVLTEAYIDQVAELVDFS